MTARAPTIIAGSAGIGPGEFSRWEFTAVAHLAVGAAQVSGRRPRVCFLGTAQGDNPQTVASFHEAAYLAGFDSNHISVIPMPNLPNIPRHLLDQDVVWVGGGSVSALLALWRLHGIDAALHAAWNAGVVLAGISAGAICWHTGGPTDSFGPPLRAETNALGFLPYSTAVHYDSEPARRPVYQDLVARRVLPPGFATEDGVALIYRGTELDEAVAEHPGRQAYWVSSDDMGEVVERPVPTRLLARPVSRA